MKYRIVERLSYDDPQTMMYRILIKISGESLPEYWIPCKNYGCGYFGNLENAEKQVKKMQEIDKIKYAVG